MGRLFAGGRYAAVARRGGAPCSYWRMTSKPLEFDGGEANSIGHQTSEPQSKP